MTCLACLGGIGLINPVTTSAHLFSASQHITAPLAAMIITQEINQTTDPLNLRNSTRRENRLRLDQEAKDIYAQLPSNLKRCVDLAKEKGASSWLTALPLSGHGFRLHKGEFRDAVCLRYDWELKNVPQTCNCGKTFTINHSMSCHIGGFPTKRHDEIRDITATLLTEVCHIVTTEPPLQPLSGETLNYRTANRDNDAHLDIGARGFWNRSQDAFFDVRIFHPNTSSYHSLSLQAAFHLHEQAKKIEYGERVREVEHGVFSPLVLSTTGGLSQEAITFYKRLADLIRAKQQKPYSNVMCWLICRLSFAISIMCVRGSRSSHNHPICETNITLTSSEGRLSIQ